MHLSPSNEYPAPVRFVDAREDLHECRLAGAVFARNGMNSAALSDDTYIVERFGRPKGLGNILGDHGVYRVLQFRDAKRRPVCCD
jgi:hypothetical protein